MAAPQEVFLLADGAAPLRLLVPDKWRSKPARKLLEVYAKKRPGVAAATLRLHLAGDGDGGAPVRAEATIGDVVGAGGAAVALRVAAAPAAAVAATCFYANLDRRPDRDALFRRRALAAGFAERDLRRFDAADGAILDLARDVPAELVTREGLATARRPPEYVNGVSLTPGAVGLALTFARELEAVGAAGDEGRVFLIAEDDASFAEDFGRKLADAVAAADAHDPGWDFLQVGYFGDDRTFAKPEIEDKTIRALLAVPESVAGTSGIAMRAKGARKLRERLYPLDWQLDTALKAAYRTCRAYCSRVPLMTSDHSTPENSDIQILPPGFRFDPNGARPASQKFKVKVKGTSKKGI